MTMLPLGDLATSFQQKLHTARIKNNLLRLTDELATGQRSDLRAATRGHFNTLAALDHQVSALKAYRTSASEAAFFTGTLQSALGTVQESMSDLAPLLLEAADSGHAPWLSAASSDARARFANVVSALNTSTADRSILGGTATSGPALAEAETMLADLTAAVAGETTATGVETIVDAWFDDPGGGYEAAGYLGSATPLAPFRVGPNESVSVTLTAADQQVRDMLKGYALAALVDAGVLPNAPAEQAALLQSAGERMFNANSTLAETRGRIGAAEAAIDDALARNVSHRSSLEMARSEIVAADPFALSLIHI